MKKRDKFFKKEKTGFSQTGLNYSGSGYGKHYGGMTNVYGFDPDGNIFDYFVTFHRSKIIIQLLISGEWWKIDEDIRGNYSTNGYSTRIGLKRANKAKCKKIADSHREVRQTGKNAHDYRVIIRNQNI